MKAIKKIATYVGLGVFGAISAGALAGCFSSDDKSSLNENVKQGAFVILEEIAPNKYKVLEEYPSSETRVVLKGLDGSERMLSQAEIDEILKAENEKIQNGTSGLTNQNAAMSSGGMSLGETILASAAGAILGSWIGSKLFNSPAYNATRQSAYKSPSAYTRSVNSFSAAKSGAGSAKTSSGKSGFFGSSSSGSSSAKSSSSFGS
ncbi:UPF0323 family lipoprotein [Campylobacter sp. 19-13652]|uniref:UPF0323 family lipoprotein n=1 Tax=Campylobacter sp. 19-13652 TaxID=2840180 RepID=UPI001C7921A8|nr:UPF0323 family lipoprotein [Campylobacter sp. 19-13652]BCX78673.1 UPF0323 lipoprotein [Campylobacter sp. 19-13652]